MRTSKLLAGVALAAITVAASGAAYAGSFNVAGSTSSSGSGTIALVVGHGSVSSTTTANNTATGVSDNTSLHGVNTSSSSTGGTTNNITTTTGHGFSIVGAAGAAGQTGSGFGFGVATHH